MQSPFLEHAIAVTEGHTLYVAEYGNQNGVPVLFIHGGPGVGTSAQCQSFFNLAHYRVIMVDQRGCGKSTPHASIKGNTTQHLIQDFEVIRYMLGIPRWLLFGGSWGSTLALCYGVAFPEHCLGFVLRGIFLGSTKEVDWFLYDMGRFFPEAYERFISYLPEAERDDILSAYYHRLTSPSHTVAMGAAQAWSSYENSCATLAAANRNAGNGALSLALIEAHYFKSNCFLPQNYLRDNIQAISHLPAEIIQGRHDVICPPHSAHELASLWGSKASVYMIDNAGHSAFETGISAQLIRSVNIILDRIG